MTNVFDDENGTFHVLVNDEGQFSLWPVFAVVPSGWSIRLESTSRAQALAFVDEHWDGLRPSSLGSAAARRA